MIGSAHSVMGEHYKNRADERVRDCTRKGSVDTANASIPLDHEVDTLDPDIADSITAKLGQLQTCVFSFGRLCKEIGCRFAWEPRCNPRFGNPLRQEAPIWIDRFVPMLDPCSTPLPKPAIATTASAVKLAVSAEEASRGRPMDPSPANVGLHALKSNLYVSS